MAVVKFDLSRQATSYGDVNVNSNKITNVSTPSANTDAANKVYVDQSVANLSTKASSRVATTAALPSTASIIYNNGTAGVGATLTRGENGALGTIDGITLIVGDRILVKDQASALQNGIYTVTNLGSGGAPYVLTRATDCDTADTEVRAAIFTFIEEGSSYEDTGWLLATNNPIVMGTTALDWIQAAGSNLITAGDGLVQNGDAFDINLDPTGGLEIVADELRIEDNYVSSKYITRETPSGVLNGSNVTFTLANTPVAGTECVYLNGVLQEPGASQDYTISGATITYLAAPISTDRLRVNYFIA